MAETVLTAAQAIQIAEGLAAAGVRCWVMGGWGIDALLGEQTRAHHDLDLLVAVSDLPSLDAWLREEGFCRAYEGQENAPARLHGVSWDMAFVEQHADGRELDIHACESRMARSCSRRPTSGSFLRVRSTAWARSAGEPLRASLPKHSA
jgi:lincosamide nucleotidyltransferase A/C/D/E